AAAGCGGSAAVTGPEAEASVGGAAVVQGTVTGAGSGLQVGVVGTSLATEIDDEGQFVLSGVPAGTVTLRFEGAGVDARVSVPGLQDGLVTSIAVQLSGGSAQLTGAPNCTPTAEAAFSGALEKVAGTQLVVGGRQVDASQVKKVWRDGRRIELSGLQVGEKLKVWGTLRGDGVVVAEEIEARTPGANPTGWVEFRGKVESVSASALDVRGSCETPTLVVAGHEVRTDGTTRFKWSDGAALSPGEIQVGDRALVAGWSKDGYVLAEKVVVDRH
ncbi:MAG TPA: DUF5666 domain-containing protein, partial [Vicinamibacteria bacterium]|nr:DUF5666 domain-containing protein [Vicinamibacteria bacterium]